MPTHVALLRGVNVGGNNKVQMSDLRQIVSSLGHTEVATYIQSGNVVFTPASGGGEQTDSNLAAGLEQAVVDRLGVRPRVVVVSRDDLAAAARANPYAAEPNHKNVHMVFLPDDPGPQVEEAVAEARRRAAARGSRDEAALVAGTLFLWTPDGFGRSELAKLLLGRAGGPVASGTARNWATVAKLLAMCDTR